MIPKPLCFACGHPIGDIAPAFRALRQRRVQQYLRENGIEDPAFAPFAAGASAAGGSGGAAGALSFRDILDRLGVRRDCCAAAVMTEQYWVDYY